MDELKDLKRRVRNLEMRLARLDPDWTEPVPDPHVEREKEALVAIVAGRGRLTGGDVAALRIQFSGIPPHEFDEILAARKQA